MSLNATELLMKKIPFPRTHGIGSCAFIGIKRICSHVSIVITGLPVQLTAVSEIAAGLRRALEDCDDSVTIGESHFRVRVNPTVIPHLILHAFVQIRLIHLR